MLPAWLRSPGMLAAGQLGLPERFWEGAWRRTTKGWRKNMEQGTLPGGPGHRGVCMLYFRNDSSERPGARVCEGR